MLFNEQDFVDDLIDLGILVDVAIRDASRMCDRLVIESGETPEDVLKVRSLLVSAKLSVAKLIKEEVGM